MEGEAANYTKRLFNSWRSHHLFVETSQKADLPEMTVGLGFQFCLVCKGTIQILQEKEDQSILYHILSTGSKEGRKWDPEFESELCWNVTESKIQHEFGVPFQWKFQLNFKGSWKSLAGRFVICLREVLDSLLTYTIFHLQQKPELMSYRKIERGQQHFSGGFCILLAQLNIRKCGHQFLKIIHFCLKQIWKDWKYLEKLHV